MKKNLIKKGLVFAVIVLFIGVNTTPIIDSLQIQKQTNYEPLPIENPTKNNSEIPLITLKVTGVTGGDNWYGSDNSFTFTYESDEIAEIYYAIDGNWELYSESFNVHDGGEHILEWYVVDIEGNQSEIDGPFYFKVDKTKPVADLEYEVVGGNQWIGFNIKLIATAVDSMIGMDCVEFYFQGYKQGTVFGSGPEYTWNIWFNPYLHPVIKARAIDKAGNIEEAYIIEPTCGIEILESSSYLENIYQERSFSNFSNNISSFEIVERKNDKFTDKSSSIVSVSGIFDPAYVIVVFNREFGENGWINSNAYFSIFYESDRIDEAYYQFNNGSWIYYTEPLVISEDGMYNFSWYVIDSNGNSSTQESISFKVDLTPPEINLIRNNFIIVKFVANVSDITSGIDGVIFRCQYNKFFDYEYPYECELPWTEFVTFGLTATVYDKAGNCNSSSMNKWDSRSYGHKSLRSLISQLFQIMILHCQTRNIYLRGR